jgi:flagellum-specific peptidoglycan hydrolase FlgJ
MKLRYVGRTKVSFTSIQKALLEMKQKFSQFSNFLKLMSTPAIDHSEELGVDVRIILK